MNKNQTMATGIEQRDFIISPQYEIFVIAMSLLQLVNSVLLFVVEPQVREIAWIMFTLTAIFLLVDLLRKLARVTRVGRYLVRRGGWMLLLGSLPVPGLVALRLLYTALVIRVMRRGEVRQIGTNLVTDKARSTFLSVVFFGILILEFASMGILALESGSEGANIQSGQDAIWWSFVTIATVGYGDRFPVTTGGRLVGVLTMTMGVGLFSVLTSFLADWFRAPRRRREALLEESEAQAGASAAAATAVDPTQDVTTQLAEIYQLLEAQEKAHAESMAAIRSRLERLQTRQETEQQKA